MTSAFLEAFADAYATSAPPVIEERPRGPWCQACAHEYRSKSGEPEAPTGTCPYCRTSAAVVNEKPFEEVSKSKLELWDTCRRRWWFKYVAKRPEPKNKYAAFGIEAHELAEAWLKRRHLPVINSLQPKTIASRAAISLLAGIPHMPSPMHAGLEIEGEFHFEFGGIHWMGYKDYDAPDARPLVQYEGPPIPLIGDHKFTGDLVSIYHLTTITLPVDMQATIEAYDHVRRGARGVFLNWVYMLRGEKAAKPVRAYVAAETVSHQLSLLAIRAREMLLALAVTDGNMLPPTTSACQKYGAPCPHMEACDVNGSQQIGSFMIERKEDKQMNNVPNLNGPSAIDALMASVSPGVAPPIVPAGYAPPAPPVAPQGYAPPAVGILPPQTLIAPAAPADTRPAETTLMVNLPGVPQPVPVPISQLGSLPAGWTPANAPASAAPVGEAPKRTRGRPKAATVVTPPEAPPTVQMAPPLAPAAPIVPTGYAPPVAPTPPAPVSNVTNILTPPAAPASAFAATETPDENAYTLYINSVPTKTPPGTRVMLASELVAAPHEAACKELGVKHYKEAQYGVGPGKLATYLEHYLLNGAEDGGGPFGDEVAILVDTRTMEGADITPTLERLARVVVRGA